ncbi:hypothetical protein GCM10010493_75460 [Streptomyces lavendulae subsp. grasserius]
MPGQPTLTHRLRGERVLHPQTPHIQQEPRDLRLRGAHAVRGDEYRDQAAYLLRISSPGIKARPLRRTLKIHTAAPAGVHPATRLAATRPRSRDRAIQHLDIVSSAHPHRPGDRLHRPTLLIKQPHPRNKQLIHSRTLRPTPSTQEPNASSHTHPSDPAKTAKVEVIFV